MHEQPQKHAAQSRATSSNRNLGQKKAKAEKRSKEELRHMGDTSNSTHSEQRSKGNLGKKDAERKKTSDKKFQRM